MKALHPDRIGRQALRRARSASLQARGRGMEMSMIKRSVTKQTLAAAAVCVALAAPALAEGDVPDSEHGRYSFSKVAEGFLRLDIRIATKHDVKSILQRLPDCEPRLPSHHHRMSGSRLSKKLHVRRIMPRQLPTLPYRTLSIDCCNPDDHEPHNNSPTAQITARTFLLQNFLHTVYAAPSLRWLSTLHPSHTPNDFPLSST